MVYVAIACPVCLFPMVPLVGQSPTALQACPRSQTNFASFNIAWSSFRGSVVGVHSTHTDTHLQAFKQRLCCNFPAHQLSRVYFRMLQRLLDWCGYTWQMVAGVVCEYMRMLVCVIAFVPSPILCAYVCMARYTACVRLHISPFYKKQDANILSAVLRVINHTATLIYVPLLVALSFILGGEGASPMHSSGEIRPLYVAYILLFNSLCVSKIFIDWKAEL